MDNYKYTTAEEIMSRVNAVHPHKPTNITDFINWCAQCEVEEIKEYQYNVKFKNVKLEVINGKAKLPCNVWRILALQEKIDGDYYTNYTENGSYVFVKDNYGTADSDGKKWIYLSYEGLPVDGKTGMPLVLKGHEAACEAYCVMKMYYEDYLTEVISDNRWNKIEDVFTMALAKTNTRIRHTSYADKQKYYRIMYNMVQDVRYYKPQ